MNLKSSIPAGDAINPYSFIEYSVITCPLLSTSRRISPHARISHSAYFPITTHSTSACIITSILPSKYYNKNRYLKPCNISSASNSQKNLGTITRNHNRTEYSNKKSERRVKAWPGGSIIFYSFMLAHANRRKPNIITLMNTVKLGNLQCYYRSPLILRMVLAFFSTGKSIIFPRSEAQPIPLALASSTACKTALASSTSSTLGVKH